MVQVKQGAPNSQTNNKAHPPAQWGAAKAVSFVGRRRHCARPPDTDATQAEVQANPARLGLQRGTLLPAHLQLLFFFFFWRPTDKGHQTAADAKNGRPLGG